MSDENTEPEKGKEEEPKQDPLSEYRERINSVTRELAGEDPKPEEDDPKEPGGKEGEDPSPEKEPEPQKYSIKIDGEDVELTLEELRTHASKAKGADKKFAQASELVKKAETDLKAAQQFAHLLKTNPFDTVKKIVGEEGFRQFVEQGAQTLLDDLDVSPQEKEARKLKLQNESLQKEKQRLEDERRKELEEKQRQKDMEETQREIRKVIQGSLMPPTTTTERVMAQTALDVREKLGKDVTLPEVVEAAQENWLKEIRSNFEGRTAEEIETILGENVNKTLREKRVKTYQKQTASTTTQRKKKESKKTMSNEEFWSKLRGH